MKRCANISRLNEWLSATMTKNLSYYSERKSSFMSFSLLISLRAIPNDDDFVLESEDYNKIWQFFNIKK